MLVGAVGIEPVPVASISWSGAEQEAAEWAQLIVASDGAL
jgi:hypothetical protein